MALVEPVALPEPVEPESARPVVGSPLVSVEALVVDPAAEVVPDASLDGPDELVVASRVVLDDESSP